MSRLANQLPSKRLSAPGHFRDDRRNVWNVVQDAETGNEVEGVVGKGHVSTDVGLHVFKHGILELACWFENCYLLGAAQDRSKFIPIGTAEAEDVLKRHVAGKMPEPVPPVPGMVGIHSRSTLLGQPVVRLFLVAEPSFYLIGREVISVESFSVRVLFKARIH